MRCYICDKDDWASLKELKLEREMLVCKDCGNVCYHIEPDHEKKLKEYYDKEYRVAGINVKNITTTGRKMQHIDEFLSDFLKQKEKRSPGGQLQNPLICGDVGCATGYVVNWLRSRGHKATGSEWTTDMRRFAEHFYSIPITEELETKERELVESLFNLKFQHATGQLDNTAQLKKTRKDIARVNTILVEKRLAQ